MTLSLWVTGTRVYIDAAGYPSVEHGWIDTWSSWTRVHHRRGFDPAWQDTPDGSASRAEVVEQIGRILGGEHVTHDERTWFGADSWSDTRGGSWTYAVVLRQEAPGVVGWTDRPVALSSVPA